MTSVNRKYGELRTDKELADQLGISEQTVKQRRSEGKPIPRYVKLSSRCVRTPQKCIDQFIDDHFIG